MKFNKSGRSANLGNSNNQFSGQVMGLTQAGAKCFFGGGRSMNLRLLTSSEVWRRAAAYPFCLYISSLLGVPSKQSKNSFLLRSSRYAAWSLQLSRRHKKMIIQNGQRYRCQSPNCRDEIEARKEGSNALCHCGARMKKVYSKPVFLELSEVEAIAGVGDITPPNSALASQNRE